MEHVATRAEFEWRGHEEGLVYAAAIASYVGLGVALQSVVLNWIVGPLYFVCFVWGSSAVVGRRRRRRR